MTRTATINWSDPAAVRAYKAKNARERRWAIASGTWKAWGHTQKRKAKAKAEEEAKAKEAAQRQRRVTRPLSSSVTSTALTARALDREERGRIVAFRDEVERAIAAPDFKPETVAPWLHRDAYPVVAQHLDSIARDRCRAFNKSALMQSLLERQPAPQVTLIRLALAFDLIESKGLPARRRKKNARRYANGGLVPGETSIIGSAVTVDLAFIKRKAERPNGSKVMHARRVLATIGELPWNEADRFERAARLLAELCRQVRERVQ
jgi:hypothetical protein